MPTLNWIGKEKVVNHHLDVPFRTLEKQYTYASEGQDDGGNMIIHGDNLDALKALLPQFEGRVKCIYIDPPYNTGNDGWKYSDNVTDPHIREWLGKVVGSEGEDLCRHDKWLCMMYPRLKLLHKLLAEDGVIFISIDDNEQHNARNLINEIFGARNFITNLIWRKVDSPNDNKVAITPDHEFILAFAKNIDLMTLTPMSAPDIVDAYGQVDENGRRYRDRLLKKNGKNSLRQDRPTMYFPILAPDGSEVYPIHDNGEEARWAMGTDGVAKAIEEGRLIWKRRVKLGIECWEPYTREYAPDLPTRPYPSIWADLDTMRQAKAMLRDIFETSDLFETPKPVDLVERLLTMVGDPNAIVLDSFAGSGTTAHAVLNMNKRDGGHRSFILVEKMEYAEAITATRVKKAIKGYVKDAEIVIFDEEITVKNLAEGSSLLSLAKDIAKDSKAHYKSVKSPKVNDGHLQVIAVEEQKEDGLGGGFSFYELGEPLLQDGLLNPNVPVEKIREYVFYTETKAALPAPSDTEKYLLGVHDHHAYYFYYEPDQLTTLNRSFLRTIQTKAEGYLIYADVNALSPEDMERYHITFKKIPRDIALL